MAHLVASGTEILEVDRLRVTYAGNAAPALDGISFSLAKGEALGIYGPSGSGKSTLALALAGLLPPGATVAARQLDFGGRSLLGLPERAWRPLRGAEIACVFQQPFLALSPWRRVGDQVADVLRAHSAIPSRNAGEKARGLLADFGLDPALAEAFPHQLSGGQRQRVIFCQALAAGPKLLIADEPTASLDDDSRDRLLDMVAQLRRERGLSLLWISHDAEVLERVADRILVIGHGRQITSTITAPASPPPPAPPAADAEIVVEAQGVTVERGRGRFFERRRRRHLLLDGIDFTLRQGEVAGLHGDSGSGKTTLLRCLAGLLPPTRGSVAIAGEDVAAASPARRRALRRQIQMVGQDPARWVDPRWPLWRTVTEGLLDQPDKGAVPLRERAATAMAELGLGDELLDRRPGEVSGGQLQRALLARALLCGARALLLDEAFSALDPDRRAALLELLLGLRERHGLALLLVSHQKSWLHSCCTRTLEMRPGGGLLA